VLLTVVVGAVRRQRAGAAAACWCGGSVLVLVQEVTGLSPRFLKDQVNIRSAREKLM